MTNSIFAALTSFFVSLILIPFIIKFSEKKNLFDTPGGRRIHKKVTPSLGGIAIFFGFISGSVAWTDNDQLQKLLILLAVLTIPFIIGFLDDLIHLKPVMKIIGQAVAAALVFFILDVRINSFYGLFGDTPFSEPISFFFTLAAIILITNSFNLIDGIDGLAATFSLTALLFLGVWFHFADINDYALLCFALSGGIMAFLFQNWEPSKIFMGDTGSLIIGMMLSILIIKFLNYNYAMDADSDVKFLASIGTATCIIIISLVDTIRVVILRLAMKISPFTPDKRHIHHVLVRLGNSHRFAVTILCLTHIFFIALAILLRKFDDVYVLATVSATAVSLSLVLDRILYKYTYNKKD